MEKAILIVDMLNDFVQENGKLPVPGAKEIIDNIRKIRGTAKEHDTLVIYANDSHSPGDPEFKSWPDHAIAGTWGADVVEELTPENYDEIIYKQELSVFTHEYTDPLLRECNIDELYVTGVATEYCVRGATLDALSRGYKVNVVVDAIRGVDLKKGDIDRAIKEMKQTGARFINTEKVLEELVK